MEKYNIAGMSCAACSSRVEKAVSSVPGVEKCNVNLLTNSMVVEGTASSEEIISAVSNAGYSAEKYGKEEKKNSNKQKISDDNELKTIRKRLIFSGILLVVLMYFSMGQMLFKYEFFGVFKNNPIGNGIAQLILSAMIMVINQKFFISGYKSIVNRAPNMDSLVSIGSLSSFLYSVYVLFEMTIAVAKNNHSIVHSLAHELYFESAAMILTLITVGKMLETYSKGKTTNAIKSLIELAPKTANVIRKGKELVIPAEEVLQGDVFVVYPGKSVPVDGEVIEGRSTVNESSLTGESLPVDKNVGDKVSAATINQSGVLKCKATNVGEDTTLSKIIQMVSDAVATKAPIAKIADKVSGVFVPIVLGISLVTLIVWLAFGETFGFALGRSICVLVISCPCALGLATPVAIMVGNGVGAKNGILYKTSEALEIAGRIKVAAFDKTGTITKGEPQVCDVILQGDISKDEFLKTVYSLEKNSVHPLAKAVVEKCKKENIPFEEIQEFVELPGNGVRGILNGNEVFGGNIRLMKEQSFDVNSITSTIDKLSEEGKTPMIFSINGSVVGIIAVADVIKDDAKEAISLLKKIGIKPIMITGDNERTGRYIASQVGIDEVIANVLPDGKEIAIKSLKKSGKVLMVGDGINDAPALTSADIGIAIGAGTDIAVESADIVLAKSCLSDVVNAIKLSRATLKNIKQNLFWAFFYNAVGIPLAAGLWIPITGWELHPMFGAAAMSLSSFCVISNALRLNLFKFDKIAKEKSNMEIVLKIEGMMCPHCEGRVKTALESAEGVISAVVSHEKDEAIVTYENSITPEEIKSIVENQGYKVL